MAAPTLGSVTEITFTNLDGAADNDRDQSAGVDIGACHAVRIFVQCTPTAGSGDATGFVEFAMAESMDGTTTDLSAGASGSDATYAPTGEEAHYLNARVIGRLSVDGTTTQTFKASFVVYDPARYISIISNNQVGEALSSTAGNNIVEYQTIVY